MNENKYVKTLKPTWKKNRTRTQDSIDEKIRTTFVDGTYKNTFTDSDGNVWYYMQDVEKNLYLLFNVSKSTTQRWLKNKMVAKSKEGGLCILRLLDEDEQDDTVYYSEASLTSKITTLAKMLTDVTTTRSLVEQMDEAFNDEPDTWGDESEVIALMKIIKSSLWQLSNVSDNLALSLSENINS